jgi:thiol-disulfide isomerase/thioredoxin/outer membrane lipoprotein-sorting protein
MERRQQTNEDDELQAYSKAARPKCQANSLAGLHPETGSIYVRPCCLRFAFPFPAKLINIPPQLRQANGRPSCRLRQFGNAGRQGRSLVILKKFLLLFFLVPVPLGQALGAEPPTTEQILQKVVAVYHNLENYRLEGTISRERKAEGFYERREIPVLQMGMTGGKRRTELGWPRNQLMTISDGQKAWLYLNRTNQYAQGAPDQMEALASVLSAGNELSLGSLFTLDYAEFAGRAQGSQLISEESLEINGKLARCYLLEIPPSSDSEKGAQLVRLPARLWVDKEQFIILKQVSIRKLKQPPSDLPSEITETITLSQAQIGGPLEEKAFSFSPPPQARLVRILDTQNPSRAGLQGKEAFDFTLKSVEGIEFNLKELRGKVVLLDFWATWCLPCRIELPIVEKIHKEFKDKGLVVLGIDDEPADQVRPFLKETGITFPTLLDTEDVVDRYQVQAIPSMILIDREGKVAWQQLGTTSETGLRKALQKLEIY